MLRKEVKERWLKGKKFVSLLEKAPTATSHIESFIVLLSAREAVTLQQLRQTFIYMFMPAISILHLEIDDPFKEGSRALSRLPLKEWFGVVIVQKLFLATKGLQPIWTLSRSQVMEHHKQSLLSEQFCLLTSTPRRGVVVVASGGLPQESIAEELECAKKNNGTY